MPQKREFVGGRDPSGLLLILKLQSFNAWHRIHVIHVLRWTENVRDRLCQEDFKLQPTECDRPTWGQSSISLFVIGTGC